MGLLMIKSSLSEMNRNEICLFFLFQNVVWSQKRESLATIHSSATVPQDCDVMMTTDVKRKLNLRSELNMLSVYFSK